MESADISVNNEMDFDDNLDDEVREVLGADIGVDLEDPSITNTNASSSMKRPRETAKCWQYFTRLGKSLDGKERAECNRCKKQYLVGVKVMELPI